MRIGRHQTKPEKLDIHFADRAKEIGRSTIYAVPALLMPIIIYGSIYGGLCTVTEAGAVSCVYGILYFFALRLIDRSRIKVTFWKCCAIAGASTATIGLLNAFSAVAGKVMTLAGISNFLSTLITENIASKAGFLLMINLLFLFMGTFMDINATILIMTPLAAAGGADLWHHPGTLWSHPHRQYVCRLPDASLRGRHLRQHQNCQFHLRGNGA